MSVQFNTFAALLLAFPFYLAQKGKLAQYINLAKPGQNSASVQQSGAAPTNSGAGSPTAQGAASAPNSAVSFLNAMDSGQDYMGYASGLGTVLGDAAKLFG